MLLDKEIDGWWHDHWDVRDYSKVLYTQGLVTAVYPSQITAHNNTKKVLPFSISSFPGLHYTVWTSPDENRRMKLRVEYHPDRYCGIFAKSRYPKGERERERSRNRLQERS